MTHSEIRGVWIADEMVSLVFDISSKFKQKLRSKIVKIYAHYDRVSKHCHRRDFHCFKAWWTVNEFDKYYLQVVDLM